MIPTETMNILLNHVDGMKRRIDRRLDERPPYGPEVLRRLREDVEALRQALVILENRR